MTTFSFQHLRNGPLGKQEESSQVDTDNSCIVFGGVLDKRLGDEDACIVNKGVDSSEALERFAEDLLGGGELGDVSLDGEHGRVPAGLGRAGLSAYVPTPPT